MSEIDNQDLEHQSNSRTRVDNAGVKVPPREEKAVSPDSQEEIDARLMLHELLEQLKRLPTN